MSIYLGRLFPTLFQNHQDYYHQARSYRILWLVLNVFLFVWCSRRGPTFVHYKSVTQDTGDTKETAYANTFDDWGWHGNFGGQAALARMKILISGTVWSLPNRDAAT